jgi:hypothetical protein
MKHEYDLKEIHGKMGPERARLDRGDLCLSELSQPPLLVFVWSAPIEWTLAKIARYKEVFDSLH